MVTVKANVHIGMTVIRICLLDSKSIATVSLGNVQVTCTEDQATSISHEGVVEVVGEAQLRCVSRISLVDQMGARNVGINNSVAGNNGGISLKVKTVKQSLTLCAEEVSESGCQIALGLGHGTTVRNACSIYVGVVDIHRRAVTGIVTETDKRGSGNVVSALGSGVIVGSVNQLIHANVLVVYKEVSDVERILNNYLEVNVLFGNSRKRLLAKVGNVVTVMSGDQTVCAHFVATAYLVQVLLGEYDVSSVRDVLTLYGKLDYHILTGSIALRHVCLGKAVVGSLNKLKGTVFNGNGSGLGGKGQ